MYFLDNPRTYIFGITKLMTIVRNLLFSERCNDTDFTIAQERLAIH